MSGSEEKKPRRLGPAAYALATAAIALVTSGVGLLFDLKPDLRPDPRDRLGADVKVVAIEPRVTLEEWLRRGATSEEERRRVRREALEEGNEPDQAGTLFYVQTVVEGLKRDDVTLLWSLYEARTKRRVDDPAYHDQETVRLRQSTPTDRAVVLAWIPDTGIPEPHIARFEIRDEAGATLAITDTDPFSGKGE